MSKQEKSFQMKERGVMVTMVLSFVVVLAVVGMVTFRGYENKLEEQEQKDETTKANTEEIVLPEQKVEDQDMAEEAPTLPQEPEVENVDSSTENIVTAAFTENSTLDWPASGNVLMNYSMDQLTYFATLEQYRYNPALIIGGSEGEPICASAAGTVKSVEKLAQTGTTVTLDMGNGYEAVYGQLTDVIVEAGEYLVRGELLGYLNQPSKYYSVEGPNLYFEVKKDGVSVNPMDYME